MPTILDQIIRADWLKYRFASEAQARGEFARLCLLMLEGPGDRGWTTSIEVVDKQTGARKAFIYAMRPGCRTPRTASEAQVAVWSALLGDLIEPPCMAEGRALSALEVEGLAYVLTHCLPAPAAEAAKAMLTAAGVPVPDSIPQVITVALTEVLKHMEVTLVEALQGIEDAARKAREAVAAAQDPASPGGKDITTEEGIAIAKDAGKIMLTDTIGDDVPNLPALLNVGDILIGLGLQLVVKKKAA